MRRSVALPRDLVNEASTLAAPELQDNLNRLVIVALQEFVRHRKEQAFEDAMAGMAADPAIRSECAAIDREFTETEGDKLPG